MLTLERLRQVVDFDADRGTFRWRCRPRSEFLSERLYRAWNAKYAGQMAGRPRSDGYVRIGIDGVRYLAHRLVWFILHGEWPDVIDHIDGDPSNNAPDNLRSVSQHENLKNARISSTNSSGVTGVYWDRNAGKWHAQIRNGVTNEHIGLFETIEDAAAARKAKETELGFHPNHGRRAA